MSTRLERIYSVALQAVLAEDLAGTDAAAVSAAHEFGDEIQRAAAEGTLAVGTLLSNLLGDTLEALIELARTAADQAGSSAPALLRELLEASDTDDDTTS